MRLNRYRMKLNIVNVLLIVTGWLCTVGTSIYAARPWGGNYAYQDASGYFALLLWELWIGLPFVILLVLNRAYRHSAAHLKLLLFACLIGSIFAAYVYVDATVFSISSTSALIFIFLPAYQLVLLAIVAAVCWVMTIALRSKRAQNSPP